LWVALCFRDIGSQIMFFVGTDGINALNLD
jgi:hypothetical protein